MKISDLKEYKVVGYELPEEESKVPAAKPPQKNPLGAVGDFGVGVLKGVGSTVEGLDKLTRKIPGLKQVQETFNPRTEEDKKFGKELTTPKNTAQKIGKGVEQIGEYFIPGAAGLKAAKGAKLLTKVGMGALETGVVGTAQTGSVKEGAKAAAIGGAIPVVGKVLSPVTKLMGRLLKGVGTGLSGMSGRQLKAILDDPQASKQFVKQIRDSGGAELLRQESKTIIDGVSKIRQEARKAFGAGLEKLSKEEVPKETLRNALQKPLQKYGVSVKNGALELKNVEFDHVRNITKAKELITRVNQQKDLSGTAIRKLIDDIENSAYKITGGEAERLAFNSFVSDLASSIKKGVVETSPMLQRMNQAFTQEMQLAESVEKIFGEVKFKNAKELLGVSQKLESLFNQKGLSPKVVDDFLNRIGVEPSKFKAGEAVRQVGELVEKPNTIGTNPFEIFRAITAAIVPPERVRDIAIQTGLAENVIKEIAKKLSPATRGALFRVILSSPEVDNNQQ